MKQMMKKWGWAALLAGMLIVFAGLTAFASDDNSLADLGITTEGVTVTPDFSYDTWTYDVTVPAGTTELALSPVPSSSAATIAGISGTTLNPDGTGTVYITVQAASGAQFTYTLNVTGGGAAPAAQPETSAPETQPATEAPAPQTEPPTEPQTEDSRFVKVDKNTIQEAENTITNLKNDIAKYRDTISLYTRIMYGLIAVAVVLLFIVINLILRKRDLKAELNDYRSLSTKKGKPQKASKVPPQPRGPQNARPAGPARTGAPVTGKGAKGQTAPVGAGPDQANKAAASAPQGQVSGQIRGGQIQYRTPGGALDVQPQTSSHRKLPEYQKEDMAGSMQGASAAPGPQNTPAGPEQTAGSAARSAAAPAAADPAAGAGASKTPAPQGDAPLSRGERRNVEVDMIEL